MRTALEEDIRVELEASDAAAYVHVGPTRDPGVRYCLAAQASGRGGHSGEDGFASDRRPLFEATVSALAFDGEWIVETAPPLSSTHPAQNLAARLAERVDGETVLTPAHIPHDSALHLENKGFSLASTDVVARGRGTKTADERARIERAQRAAGRGIRRAASLLADATVENDRLRLEGAELTPGRLRIAIDEGIVSAGGYPAGNTTVDPGADDGPLRSGDPIVLGASPRGAAGYYGGLVRTLVVDGEGGRERRAHVGVTQSFRSARAMLTAGAESVRSVETDLEAEIRAFGEDDAVETRVSGVGLEAMERPVDGGDNVEPGTVVRLEAAARVGGNGWIRIADVFAKGEDGVDRLEAPSRSLEPSTVLE
nr:M24 family metallopeptidase [Natrarchaeobius halalkaliphilus]